jgi:hypothetical protein
MTDYRKPLSARAAEEAFKRLHGEGAKLEILEGYAYTQLPGEEEVVRHKVSEETLRALARIDEGYTEDVNLRFEPPNENDDE